MKAITEQSDYWFMWSRIWIIADLPGAEEKMKAHPELPSATLVELEAAAKSEEAAEALLRRKKTNPE